MKQFITPRSLLNEDVMNKIDNLISGTKHDTLGEAILSDIISSVPIAGTISDFVRLSNSETRPRRVLQTLDLITGDLPTPTNTLLFLSDNGKLPIKIEEIDEFFSNLKSPRKLLFKRIK